MKKMVGMLLELIAGHFTRCRLSGIVLGQAEQCPEQVPELWGKGIWR